MTNMVHFEEHKPESKSIHREASTTAEQRATKTAATMHAYFGPNQFAPTPVVVTNVTSTQDIRSGLGHIWDKLAAAFPQWMDKTPETDNPTLAMALMAASWCKGILNSKRGLIQTSGASVQPSGNVVLWVGFHIPDLTITAIGLSMRLIRQAATMTQPFPDITLTETILTFQNTCRRLHPDYNARILMLGAQSADIPFLKSPMAPRLWQYGWGCKSQVFLEASPITEGFCSVAITGNKAQTTQYLKQLGFPVPVHTLASTREEAWQKAQALGFPVVIKPIDQGQGRGVTVGIVTPEKAALAYDLARRHSNAPIAIERYVPGFDHRLLVVRGQLVAAVRREPATVVGDGISSVEELVAGLNAHRRSQPLLARYLKQIAFDPIVESHLAEQGYDRKSKLAAGQRLTLRGNANVSTGGTSTDVMHLLNSDVRVMAESIARNFRLDCVGIDYITDDIGGSWRTSGGCVTEVNVTPGLDVHGSEKDIGRLILGPSPGRIPVVVVVADPNDQRALLNSLKFQCSPPQTSSAILGPDFSQIAGMQIERSSALLPDRVNQILANHQVERAIICVTPDEIDRFGLPVDRCDLMIRKVVTMPGFSQRSLFEKHAVEFVDLSHDEDWPTKPICDRINLALSTYLSSSCDPELKQPSASLLNSC